MNKNIAGLACFLLLLAGYAAADVAWSSISTAAQMAAVPPQEFLSLNSSLTASIQSVACGGFQIEQVANIPGPAFAGFTGPCMAAFNASAAVAVTANQMSNLKPGFANACSYLKFPWLANVPTAALEGWDPVCVGEVSEYVFGQMDPAFLQRFPVTPFSGAIDKQIAKINASYVSVLSAEQIATMKKNCYGWERAQLQSLPAPLWSNFSKECIGHISYFLWSTVTAQQFLAIKEDSLGDLDRYDTETFNFDICGVLTPSTLLAMSKSACGGIKDECAAKIPIATWAAIPLQCFTQFSGWTLHYMDAPRIAVLTPATCAAMSQYSLEWVNTSASYAFTAECVASFGSNCRGFKAAAFSTLSVASFAQMTLQCVQATSSDAWGLVSPAQVAALQPAVCAGFGAWTVIGLNATAYAGVSSECFYKWAACNNLNTPGISYLQPEIFSSMTPSCLNGMSASKITAAQIAQIPVTTFAQWDSSMQYLTAQALSGANSSQVVAIRLQNLGLFNADQFASLVRVGGVAAAQAWNNTGLGGVSRDVINDVKRNISDDQTLATTSVPFPGSPAAVASTSWLYLYFSNATSESYTLSVWQQLPTSSLSGIPTRHVPLIGTSLWANVSSQQSARLTKDIVGVMSAEQFLALQPPAIRNIKYTYWDAISPAILSQLSPDQVANIYSSSFSVMFCYQLQSFSSSQFSKAGPDVKNSYAAALRPCTGEPFQAPPPIQPTPPPVAPAPVAAPIAQPAASPSSENIGNSPQAPGGGNVALIVIVVLLSLIIVVMVGVYFLYLRKPRTGYESLT